MLTYKGGYAVGYAMTILSRNRAVPTIIDVGGDISFKEGRPLDADLLMLSPYAFALIECKDWHTVSDAGMLLEEIEKTILSAERIGATEAYLFIRTMNDLPDSILTQVEQSCIRTSNSNITFFLMVNSDIYIDQGSDLTLQPMNYSSIHRYFSRPTPEIIGTYYRGHGYGIRDYLDPDAIQKLTKKLQRGGRRQTRTRDPGK